MKNYTLLILLSLFLFTSFKSPKVWVAIGDSITYLNDHLDETGNRVTKGYMTLVADHMPDISYINQGHNGWTAVNIAKEIESLGVQYAEIYSVFLGTNDWWSGVKLGTMDDYVQDTGTGTFYGAYRKIIQKLKSLNPKASIILITPMQRVDFVYLFDFNNNAFGNYKAKYGQHLAQFALAIKDISKYEKIDLVDLYHSKQLPINKLVRYKRLKNTATGEYENYKYPDFTTIPFNPQTDQYPYPEDATDLTYDGLHPSDKGYKVIADLIVKAIK